MKIQQPFLSVKRVTIRQGEKFFFENTSWTFYKGENWLIYGANGSGKSVFAKAISGLLPTKQGEIICHFSKKKYLYPQQNRDAIQYLSFESQNNIIQKEEKQKDSYSVIGNEKKSVCVKEYLGKFFLTKAFRNTFSIDNLLNKEITNLSSGEMRKVFILKALLNKPELLVLDEPFDGLDVMSKKNLMKLLNILMKKIHVILIVHKYNEIPQYITHILLMKDCTIMAQGEKNTILNGFSELFQSYDKTGQIYLHKHIPIKKKTPEMLIQMHNVTVQFGKKKILQNINWTMKQGENWGVLGPNGAGKSTLIQLIYGEQLQAYANNITLFGLQLADKNPLEKRRKAISVVSPLTMMRYEKSITVSDVILSGHFDSIGLYKRTSDKQKKKVNFWLKRFKIQEIYSSKFQELSYGQKQLVLIIRAMLKKPKVLILDEPCNALDNENKKRVLAFINEIGMTSRTNLILITHNKDEIIPCINYIMYLKNGKITKIIDHKGS